MHRVVCRTERCTLHRTSYRMRASQRATRSAPRTMHEGAPLTPRPWRRQLQEERKVRQQKEQYAALARQINQYPPREETQAEIQALSAELVPPACP